MELMTLASVTHIQAKQQWMMLHCATCQGLHDVLVCSSISRKSIMNKLHLYADMIHKLQTCSCLKHVFSRQVSPLNAVWNLSSFSFFWQPKAEELCAFWPHKGQPYNYGVFTVSHKSENHVCLSNEDILVVQDYMLEATQVGQSRIFCAESAAWLYRGSRVSETLCV